MIQFNSYVIYDMKGRKLQEGGYSERIELEQLMTGSFHLLLKSDDGWYSTVIVKMTGQKAPLKSILFKAQSLSDSLLI